MPLTDPGLAGWVLLIAIFLIVIALLVYVVSREATRDVVGQICNIDVSTSADGRTIFLKNTGALALVDIVVDRHPPQAGKFGHLWSVPSLAAGAAVTAHVPQTTSELPTSVLMTWRVGSPTGPAFTVIRPMVRAE